MAAHSVRAVAVQCNAVNLGTKVFPPAVLSPLVEARSLHGGLVDIPWKEHPLVAAAVTAFQHHLNLVLTPDIIWLAIAQGFAAHVNAHAEDLRKRLVAHDGRCELRVERNEFIPGHCGNDWSGVFSEFSQAIREHIGPEMHTLLVPSFSTTDCVARSAFELTLMETVKSYFSYSLRTMCGIPQVILEGEVRDWEAIRDRVPRLAEYGLRGWGISLLEVLDEFVAGSDGRGNPDFWKSFVKFESVSGGAEVTGAITVFFPYIGKHLPDTWNPCAEKWRNTYGVPLGSFPSGLSNTSFVWDHLGHPIPMTLQAGFTGTTFDDRWKALKPVIGWVVQRES